MVDRMSRVSMTGMVVEGREGMSSASVRPKRDPRPLQLRIAGPLNRCLPLIRPL